jgi:hypothetical protein
MRSRLNEKERRVPGMSFQSPPILIDGHDTQNLFMAYEEFPQVRRQSCDKSALGLRLPRER